MQTGREAERKKLVYRQWSSFPQKSVVIMSGWRGQGRCVSLRLEEVSGDHQPEEGVGLLGMRSGGEAGGRPPDLVTNARRPAAGVCSAA